MTTARIDWTTPPSRLVPVLLVAGLPLVIVPAGEHPTTVAVTSGTIDAAWWPGTGTLTETLPDSSSWDPVRDWLDATQALTVSQQLELRSGVSRVDALSVDLHDVDGEVTSWLSNPHGRVIAELAADITASALTLTVRSAAGLPASGVLYVGRETIAYDSIAGTTLTLPSSGRGRYGSKAQAHAASAETPLLATAGASASDPCGPRYWYGRTATLWLCELSADGATLRDPTLVYRGTIGAGIALMDGLTAWRLPIDHVLETLTRKVPRLPVSLLGISHHLPYSGDTTSPLGVYWDSGDYDLGATSSAQDAYGWHADWDTFVRAWNSMAASGGLAARWVVGPRIRISYSAAGARDLRVYGGWFDRVERLPTSAATGVVEIDATPPEAFLHLRGPVRLAVPGDIGKIPTTIAWTSGTGTARLALAAETERDAEGPLVCAISARSSSPPEVTLEAPPETAPEDTLILRRTEATVAVVARGDTFDDALRAAASALDAVFGGDLYAESVDWDAVAAFRQRYPTGSVPEAREYRFSAESESFLDVLTQEARLRGGVLAVRRGRIAPIRFADLALTENAAAEITSTDYILDAGAPRLPTVLDATEPVVTTMRFPKPDGSEVTVRDRTFSGEFGDGDEVTVGVLGWIPEAVMSSPALHDAIAGLASTALRLLAEPSRQVTVVLGPPFFGLDPGDVVLLSDGTLPGTTGSRGLSEVICQVIGVGWSILGGRAERSVTLRLGDQTVAGYAPSAFVAAGGLAAASVVVTLDGGTGWGTDGFAETAAGVTDGFEVGDEVMLQQYGVDVVTVADEQRTIASIDRGAGTITLDAAPSAGMAAAAASQYGVMLTFVAYGSAVASQREYAFIADGTTELLGGADPPDRWAA